MNDQARALRAAAAASPLSPAPSPGGAEAIVIGSGKGGAGKSLLSVQVAAQFAREGRRTLLLDGAQNQGNLHVMLGARPAAPLAALTAGEVAPEDLLVEVAADLWLLPADSGAESTHGLTAVDRARLHHRLSDLYDLFDAVVVDAGPGLESAVRVCAMRASRLVVVAVPEPAALSDAYALMKIVHVHVPSLPHDVIVNRTREPGEGPAVYERLKLACERFLRRTPGYLGDVPDDAELGSRVRRPGALLEHECPSIGAVARRLAPHTRAAAEAAVAAPSAGRTRP